MPQLVGQNCVLCAARISSELDSHFCAACRNPVHNACAQAALTHPPTGCCGSCGGPVPEVKAAAGTNVTDSPARTEVRPAGYPQLACLAAILVAAAVNLPAQTVGRMSGGFITIFSSTGGELVFAGVAVGGMLTVLQIVALGSVAPRTGRFAAALVVSGVGVCIGLAISWLGFLAGWVSNIPKEEHPSPAVGALVVMLAGAGFAYFSGLRLWRLLRIKQAEPRMKMLLAVVVAACLIAGGLTHYLAPPPEREPRLPLAGEQPMPVTAEELSDAYRRDPKGADERFKDRFIEVSGEVMGVDSFGSKNSLHIMMLNQLSVDCIVPERHLSQFADVMPNDRAVIRGICTGKYPTDGVLIVEVKNSELVRLEKAVRK